MERIRQILLDHYVGAITIGFIFAQAVVQLINALVQVGTNFWLRQFGSHEVDALSYFNWTQFLVSVSSTVLHVLAGFLLLYWVYAEPKGSPGQEDSNEETVDGDSKA